MPDAHKPFAETTQEREDRRNQSARQLVLAYKRCFSTASGMTVLEDLKQRFGFNRWPAEDTEDERKIARRVFAQGPLYHIEKQLKTTFREGKPKRPERQASP